MPTLTEHIVKKLPRWVFTVAFLVLLLFMVLSLFLGPFKIGGYEFGFLQKNKDLHPNVIPSSYTVIGTVETTDKANPNEVLISPQYPPLHPSAEGNIVALEVWKDPDGKFPKLNFSHTDYWDYPIDLNDTDKVQLISESLKIIIKEPIKLRPKKRNHQ